MKFMVELTEAEVLALSADVLDPKEWTKNAVKAKAASLAESVSSTHVQRCLREGVAVPATQEAVLRDAFTRGTVKTAQQREDEFEAHLAEQRQLAEANAQASEEPEQE